MATKPIDKNTRAGNFFAIKKRQEMADFTVATGKDYITGGIQGNKLSSQFWTVCVGFATIGIICFLFYSFYQWFAISTTNYIRLVVEIAILAGLFGLQRWQGNQTRSPGTAFEEVRNWMNLFLKH
jgi:hypothetical protein